MTRIVKGNTRDDVTFRLLSRGLPVNLTGETIEVRYRIGDGALKTKSLTAPVPTNGEAVLSANSDNWDAAGIATGRVYLTTAGKLGPSWVFELFVEADNHAA